jgi:hypothetical protein
MLIDEMQYEFKLRKDRVDSGDKVDFEPWEIDSFINNAQWWFLKDRYSIEPVRKKGFETDQIRISQLDTLHVKSPHLQPGLTPTLIQDGVYEVRLNDLGDNINGQYFRYLFLTDGYIQAEKNACTKFISMDYLQSDDSLTTYTEADWTWRRVNYSFGKSTFAIQHLTTPGSNQDPDSVGLIESVGTNDNLDDELVSIYLDTRDRFGEPQFTINTVYLSYIKYPNRVFFGGYDHIDTLSNSTSPRIHCDLPEAFHDEIVNIAVRLAEKSIVGDYNALIKDEMEEKLR